MKAAPRFIFWVTALAVGIMAGCVPERVAWSPDGTRGAVMGGSQQQEQNLYFCDPSGKLSGESIKYVHGMAWIDSKQLVVVHDVDLKLTWKEAQERLPREVREAKDNGASVLKFIRERTYGFEDAEDFRKRTLARLEIHADDFALALMYLREQEREAVRNKVNDKVWKYISEASPDLCAAQVYEVSETEAKPGPVLAYFVNAEAIFELRVSPGGKAVAISKGRGKQTQECGQADVTVAALDGSGVISRLEGSCFPDWSADGKSLVFAAVSGTHELLFQQRLMGADGAWLRPARLGGAANVLARLEFAEAPRIRVAGNGRIYFLSAEFTVPSPAKTMSGSPTLFWIDPEKANAVTRLLGGKSEQLVKDAGRTLAFFEVSPDGKWISAPYEDGRVVVVDVEKGTADFVQDKAAEEAMALRTVPVWRTADELTFVRPCEDGKGSEVVLWSMKEKKATVISARWPEQMTSGWLREE